MANRAQRRKQKKNKSNISTMPMGNILDTKKLDRMTNDKMIWVAMGLIGAAVLFVVAYMIILAIVK